MKKILFFISFYSSFALACPYCAGSDGNAGDKYIVYVLAGFILLTYIPFYVIFSMVKKKKNKELSR